VFCGGTGLTHGHIWPRWTHKIEWEGEVEFLKSEVPDLIASIIQAIGINIEEPPTDEDAQNDSERPSAGTFTTAAAAATFAEVAFGPGPDSCTATNRSGRFWRERL
jgi:hypothetical protein